MTFAVTAGTQAQVLEAFTVLHSVRAGWQGTLILNVGLHARGAAVSMASGVAGGVCLTLERDAEVARAALRRGACDFVVNTLDEALRAMKNEIRKGLPLSVGLVAEPESALGEILERGVSPQLLCGLDGYPGQAARLEGWGALRLSGGSVDDRQSAASVLANAVAERGWTMRAFGLADAAAVREFDARVLGLLPLADDVRRRWISSAVRLFPRERGRVVWVTGQESAELGAEPGRVAG